MTDTNVSAGEGRVLSELALNVLRALYQHRLLTTNHLIELLHPPATPEARGAGRHVQRTLKLLYGQELVSFVEESGSRLRRWFLTDVGYVSVEEVPGVTKRTHRMDATRARGPVAPHLLSINDVGCALSTWARQRGDVFGPNYWIPEVKHAYGKSESDWFTADSVITYETSIDEWRAITETRFLELDRGTETVRQLADKVSKYEEYRNYKPGTNLSGGLSQGLAWKQRYSSFPGVWVIFDDHVGTRVRPRMQQLREFLSTDERLEHPQFEVAVSTVERLRELGPFHPEVSMLIFGPGLESPVNAPLLLDHSNN